MDARPPSARRALFPGTFDPITLGHLDLIERAAERFEHVTVALAIHPSKAGLLELGERRALVEACTAHLANVAVCELAGLVVEGCAAVGAGTIVRGLRGAGDLDYELQMAGTNRVLAPEVDTVFLAAKPALAHVSSTLVRQIATLGGDVSAFVPAPVQALLAARFARADSTRRAKSER